MNTIHEGIGSLRNQLAAVKLAVDSFISKAIDSLAIATRAQPRLYKCPRRPGFLPLLQRRAASARHPARNALTLWRPRSLESAAANSLPNKSICHFIHPCRSHRATPSPSSSIKSQTISHCEDQRRDRNDCLAHRPCLDGLRHAHVEVLLYQPEAAVVDMRKDQRPRARGNSQQLRMNARPHAAQSAPQCRPRWSWPP
jgi:hypothetical protein